MLVTLIAVMSLDGCITRHTDSGTEWASDEDQQRFRELTSVCDVRIFGASTYRASRDSFRNTARVGVRKVIVTRDPSGFAGDAIADRLEFTSQSPAELVARLRNLGHERCAVLGGGEIYGQFLSAGVVDELALTIEPMVFGNGVRLGGTSDLLASFVLTGVERLNSSTLHCRYRRA